MNEFGFLGSGDLEMRKSDLEKVVQILIFVKRPTIMDQSLCKKFAKRIIIIENTNVWIKRM